MKTYVATPATRERNWLVVDASGKTLGRLATQIADALRGKRKPEYTPHIDVGDFVVVVNAEKISVTGNKRAEKRYYRHSGYPGGLRSRPMPLPTTYLFAWAPFMTSQAKLQQFLRATLGPETLRRRPKVARRLAARKLAHPQSQHAWRAQTEAGMLFNPLGRQRRITQPTLVVQGTADQVVDPGNAEVLAGLVPDARVQRFHGAGHLLYWEQPKRFVRIVTDFLTDPGSAARVPATAARRAS